MTDSGQTAILIIDDEVAIRNSFADYLEDMDFTVFTAENGRVGLEIFASEQIDLVLVDLRMPEIDGLEVLTRITESAPEVPLIVISGTGVIKDAIEAVQRGAWDYLLKPIEDLTVLLHAVTKGLEKARLKKENKSYQLHLEQMVTERTNELKAANENLTRINSRLRKIVDTTRQLSCCSDVDRFGALLLEEFGQHMMATGGSLYLKETEGLRLVNTLDPGHAKPFIAFPLEKGSVFQQVLSRNEPVLVENLNQEKGWKSSGWSNYSDGSALIFPLPDEKGNVAGVLTLHSKKSPPFLEQDKEIGTILVSYSCEALRAVRAAERLRENEQQFRMILDNIRIGIMIVREQSREIVYINPVALEMTGSSADELIGTHCQDVLCPVDNGKCPAMDLGQQTDASERLLRRNDGQLVPIFKTVTRTLYRGEPCILESFVDLTAQKQAAAEKDRLETQLRQAQKMEALGTLAGGIAHDFNNILSGVIGYAELGELELDDPENPLSEKFSLILDAGNRAKDLVSQILTFSRMQEKMLAPVGLSSIVKETLKLLKASLPANIQLVRNLATEKQVIADPTQVHQIIMNLCTNAYHAMEQAGGTLTVGLHFIAEKDMPYTVRTQMQPCDCIELVVEDTGTGIKPSVLDSIFDPYFSTKGKDKGTGLGLSVVHGIVKSHKGAILVESTVGKGTAMRVFFPVSEDNQVPERDAGKVGVVGGTERILFVDDEQSLVDIGCGMLGLMGYRVTGVVGSRKALETFRDAPREFDLVVTDMNMPEMTGDKLAAEITRITPGIPIIICTGYCERLDQQSAMEMGVLRILMKPLTMSILSEAVRSVLDQDK